MKKDVINTSALECWKQIDPDNWQAIVVDLFEIFSRTTPILMQRIAAPTPLDVTQIREASHALKSSLGTIGADRAFEICKNVERLAREQQDLPALQREIESLKDAYDETREAADHHRARLLAA